MKLYVVRHGQTLANLEKRVSGDKESPLTAKGINQARQLGEELSTVSFDVVFSSPLLRAIDTARYITSKRVYVDERLTERDYGDNEGKLMKDTDPNIIWNYNLNVDENHVEKVKKVIKRASSFIKEIKQKYPNSTVLVVTHSGLARAIHYSINDIPKDGNLHTIELSNCGYQIYDL